MCFSSGHFNKKHFSNQQTPEKAVAETVTHIGGFLVVVDLVDASG